MRCELSGKVSLVTGAARGIGQAVGLRLGQCHAGLQRGLLGIDQREGADGAVVYLQDGSRDKPGPMLGAAYTSLH